MGCTGRCVLRHPIPARNDTKHIVGINVGINFIEHILSYIYQDIIGCVRILQVPFKVSPYAQLQRTVTRGTVFLLPANVLPHKDFVGSPL